MAIRSPRLLVLARVPSIVQIDLLWFHLCVKLLFFHSTLWLELLIPGRVLISGDINLLCFYLWVKLPLLPGILWSELLVPVRIPYTGQIHLLFFYLLEVAITPRHTQTWIVWFLSFFLCLMAYQVFFRLFNAKAILLEER